ncbi:hypothetical protein N798_14590 [Knoellia flava TL1]|uniref:PknH-like extracellular domain-containing protein n=2 Tax=Knoellia flava TaxID=913969 RepID=A0A8H9FSQ6_9MICO|nr:hypothetical protein [Knoellia flava]KGN29233.1 hypothetical protein N798_14590 [Knoellia flava TL1]GGB67544.1 hypothetical protein GCM10011314_03460 [Knoellia flava]
MSPISEDELRARLRSVEPSPAAPGLADHIIGQGRSRQLRRRWLTALATAAAVAVIGVGVVAVGDQLGPDDALPASPSPTPTSAQPTPTVAPTGTPTVTTTVSPDPSSTASSTSGPTSASAEPTSTPSRTSAPAPVRLLHDGRAGWSPGELEISLCVGDARVFPAPRGTTEMRVIRADFVAGANMSEGLVVFSSSAEAVAYLADVRRIARGCTDESSGDTKVVVDRVDGPWGEGLSIASAPRQSYDGTPRWTGLGVTVFARVGAGVTFGQYASKAELTDEAVASDIAQLRPALEHVAPQLCRYTQAGC